jgi:hypothetical protein
VLSHLHLVVKIHVICKNYEWHFHKQCNLGLISWQGISSNVWNYWIYVRILNFNFILLGCVDIVMLNVKFLLRLCERIGLIFPFFLAMMLLLCWDGFLLQFFSFKIKYWCEYLMPICTFHTRWYEVVVHLCSYPRYSKHVNCYIYSLRYVYLKNIWIGNKHNKLYKKITMSSLDENRCKIIIKPIKK